MAECVTLEQFNSWFQKNRHRTWTRVEPRPKDQRLEVKYFYTSFDTRDEMIFFVGTNRDDIYGSHNDEHETILTALEARLNNEEVQPLDLLGKGRSRQVRDRDEVHKPVLLSSVGDIATVDLANGQVQIRVTEQGTEVRTLKKESM